MSSLPRLDHLPPITEQRGGDPTLVRDELTHMIRTAIDDHPRSLQKLIGPSEIGTPCDRKLVYKLAGIEESNDPGTRWKPTIGTAMHSWLQDALTAENIRLGDLGPRFYLEFKVDVGELAGEPITGHCDVYDRVTASVIDWKIVGPTTLKKVKSHGVDQTYKIQRQLYGYGWTRRGLPVDTVANFYLPRNGELTAAVWDSEPYDKSVALAAMDRLRQKKALAVAFGAKAAAIQSTSDDYCAFCPFFLPGATDLTEACPGHKTTATAAN